MERFDAACLTDAKKEYTQRFVRKLKSPFSGKIIELFKEAQDECASSHQDEKVLFTFQEKLEKIPEWEDSDIQQFSRSMIAQSKCDYLEELLQGVFIIHTKILAVIQHHKSTSKSELKLPTIEDFIFQAFINSGREVWKFAYLFSESKDSIEYQKNTNMFEKKIESCIVETIEDMLPVRELLLEHVKEYVEEEFDDDESNPTKLNKRIRGGMGLSEDDEIKDDTDDINPPMDITPATPATPAPTPVSTPPLTPVSTPPLTSPPTPESIPTPESAPTPEYTSPESKPVEIKEIELPIPDNTTGGAYQTNILDSYSADIVSLNDSESEKSISFDEPVPSVNLTSGPENMNKLSSISYSQL